jgi:myxalamid-type polyketide synthase MxaB
VRVLEPKMAGAWNLHQATRRCELDHFVCFSSFSAVCGAPRQGSYNAGNAFLDALAHYRQRRGLPALSIDWGAVAGAGFVERHGKTAEYLDRVGVKPFPLDEALDILGRLLLVDPGQIVVARVDWPSLARLMPVVASCNTYASLTGDRRADELSGSLVARLCAAEPGARSGLVEDFIVTEVAEVVGGMEAKIDRTAPLTSLGIDSLMTVELVNRMESLAGVRLPMAALFSGPSVRELARVVLRLLAPALDRPDSGAPADPTAEAAVAAPEIGHVVPIRTAGDRSPLVVFHPVGGGIGAYAALARQLPADLPLYGIESRLMRGAATEFADIDTMVRAYVAAVADVAPPPSRLFGFSLGGYVAARVAEALEASGSVVELVGVVEWDARPRLTVEAKTEALLRLSMATYRFLERQIGTALALTDSGLRRELGPLVERVIREGHERSDVFLRWAVDRGLIVGDTMHTWARQYLSCFGQHCALLAPDLPLPRLRAPLAVWRAHEGFGSGLASWQHAGVGIEHVTGGDHFAYLRPPGVLELAKQLDALLRQAPGVASPGARGVR